MEHMRKLTALVLTLCSTTVVAGTAETNRKILVTHARNIDANTADIVRLNDRVDIVKEDLVQNKVDVRRTTILGRRYTADVKAVKGRVIALEGKATGTKNRLTAVEAKSQTNTVRIKALLKDVASINAPGSGLREDLNRLGIRVRKL